MIRISHGHLTRDPALLFPSRARSGLLLGVWRYSIQGKPFVIMGVTDPYLDWTGSQNERVYIYLYIYIY